jgi:FixJ family two-component response regulator
MPNSEAPDDLRPGAHRQTYQVLQGGRATSRVLNRSRSAGNPAEADRPLIILVDDDDGFRDALHELMQSVGHDAIGFASTRDLLKSELPDRPGCFVCDVRMPGVSGLDLQRQLAESGDIKPIIFLTAYGDIPMSVQAMKEGAVDFLTKPVRDQALLDAIAAAIERDIKQRTSARVVKQNLGRLALLTPRERQVLREVAVGRLNKQIAFALGISEVTVKLHRGNVMKKMQATSVGDLIRSWEALPEAIREGRLPVPKYDSDFTRNETDGRRGRPNPVREGQSVGQSAFGGNRR